MNLRDNNNLSQVPQVGEKGGGEGEGGAGQASERRLSRDDKLSLSSRRGSVRLHLALSLSLSAERGSLNAWLFSISKNEIGIKEPFAATNRRGGAGAEGEEEVERPQRRHSHNNMAMAM